MQLECSAILQTADLWSLTLFAALPRQLRPSYFKQEGTSNEGWQMCGRNVQVSGERRVRGDPKKELLQYHVKK